MFDLSPLRPAQWLDQEVAWWGELVEARTIWDDVHRSERATTKAKAERETARRGP